MHASQIPLAAPSPATGILLPHMGQTPPRSGTGGTSTPRADIWAMTSEAVVPTSSASRKAPTSLWWEQ